VKLFNFIRVARTILQNNRTNPFVRLRSDKKSLRVTASFIILVLAGLDARCKNINVCGLNPTGHIGFSPVFDTNLAPVQFKTLTKPESWIICYLGKLHLGPRALRAEFIFCENCTSIIIGLYMFVQKHKHSLSAV